MGRKTETVRKWLNVASILVLLAGLATAVMIYQRAEEGPRHAIGYERGEEDSYPVEPGDSKKYLHDLELYGGKANVLATRFRLWFSGLWQGKSLASITALFSVLVSYGLFRAAHHRNPGQRGGAGKGPATG